MAEVIANAEAPAKVIANAEEPVKFYRYMRQEMMHVTRGWLPLLTTIEPLIDDVERKKPKSMEWVGPQVNHNTLQPAVYASIFQNMIGNKSNRKRLPDTRLDNDKLYVVVFDEVSCS